MTSVCSWPAPLACLVIRKPLRFWPKARSKAKTRQGPSFAQQKFFAPCLKSLVLSECGGAKEGEGGRPGMGGLSNGFRMVGWRTCFERWLEPRAAELPRNDGPIAGEESVQRPTVEYARRQGRGKVACDHVCGCWLDRQFDGDNSPLFHRHVVSVWASWRPRLQLRVAIDRSGTGGRATMFNAGLFRAPAFPHDSLSSPPSANPTREAGFYAPTVQCLGHASHLQLFTIQMGCY